MSKRQAFCDSIKINWDDYPSDNDSKNAVLAGALVKAWNGGYSEGVSYSDEVFKQHLKDEANEASVDFERTVRFGGRPKEMSEKEWEMMTTLMNKYYEAARYNAEHGLTPCPVITERLLKQAFKMGQESIWVPAKEK